ncbi:hypothetical protein LOM8899_02480 [Flavimaricola marinus]|uniref:Group 4 capsule polysaccharide lipoprotein gfcB, YjbF n=2 Tax=Flavimaricola marinus TaxID=1819565 RepID=A0A238LF74_9RHOB|nr:hypothetical protein LOM8899_02480 [Flavimaricola marinus]
MIKQTVAAMALMAMTGCSAISGAAGMVGNVVGGPAAPSMADSLGFGPDDVVADPDAFILVQVSGRDIAGLAREVNANGDVRTWIGESGYSITLDDGLLVATRGLGDDLIAANTAGVRAALRNGGGTTERQHDYIDALDQIRTETYDCAVVRVGPEEVDLGVRKETLLLMTETCQNQWIRFENRYFVDNTGTIIAARQFVSQTVAYLRNNSL